MRSDDTTVRRPVTDATGIVASVRPQAVSEVDRNVLTRNRVALLIAITGVVFAGIALLIIALLPSSSSRDFIGTLIEPPLDALDFSLVNQHGQKVTLSELRGKPVILTFLYTSCADICPFVGIKMKQLIEALGDEADEIEILVVSTDPERDTPERIAEYSRSLGMFNDWNYLIGEKDQLAPIWDAYFIGQPIISDGSEFATREDLDFYGLTTGLDEREIEIADGVRGRFGGGYDVSHGTPIWLIDINGRIRVKLDTARPPADYLHDIRLMIGNMP